MTDLN